jgi:hypothetical protein
VKLALVLAATLLAVVSSLAFVVEIFPLTAETGFASLCSLLPCPTTEPVDAESQEARIARLTEALRREPASPYAWCDLGEALHEAGDQQKAAHCMQRALDLGGGIPSVLMRVAEFHLDRREHENALRAMSQVLRLAGSFDDAVFGYYADIGIPIPMILKLGLPADARPRQAFFEHALGWAYPEGASLIWESLAADSLTTDRLAGACIDYLIVEGLCDQAREIWAAHLGERRGAYLESNWLFNGGFERTFTGAAFDWRIREVDGVEARSVTDGRDGNFMLRIAFAGTHNVNYSHLSQTACLSPGEYAFHARVQTAEITTDQAPYVHIHDRDSRGVVEVNTPHLRDLAEWTAIEAQFTVDLEATPVIVEVRRDPSLKFDNKISGTIWIDDATLERVGLPQ